MRQLVGLESRNTSAVHVEHDGRDPAKGTEVEAAQVGDGQLVFCSVNIVDSVLWCWLLQAVM